VKYEIKYTSDAVDDLDGIFSYISESNQAAAAKMLTRLEKAILNLSDNPRMGSVLPQSDFAFISPGYRKIVVQPYIVFYRVGEHEVYISRILHSKQNWLQLVFNSNFEEA